MINKIEFNISKKGGHISKYIYGHFAEHLGRCIYDGFWVGKGSDIPNINGMRTDVIEALKKNQCSCFKMAGRLFCR